MYIHVGLYNVYMNGDVCAFIHVRSIPDHMCGDGAVGGFEEPLIRHWSIFGFF